MKLKLESILTKSERRPRGYYEDVVSRGVIVGDSLELSETAYEELKVKYDPEHIGLSALIKNFATAIARWAARGFPVVSKPEFDQRLNTCRGCEEWTGLTCRKCGCTGLKHWLATERCPLGKWKS